MLLMQVQLMRSSASLAECRRCDASSQIALCPRKTYLRY